MALIIDGYDKFAAFITWHPSVQFIHLQWTDYTSTVRVRILTLRHFQALLEAKTNLALCRHYLCLIDIGLPLTNVDPGRPAGQSFLLPDFNTIHLCPSLNTAEEHAVLLCYFGNGTPLHQEIHHSPLTLSAPFCPRRALLQAIQAGEEIGLYFRVGFELEFSAVQPKHSAKTAEIHASSGLRAIESFMLPVLSTITKQLESAANVPVEQFHCEGSDNAYELVLGHLPPMEAVDGLVTAKETTRRVCRENGIEVLFNPTMPEINGLHTNISVQSLRGEVGEVEESFLAGVMQHLGALCAFAMPRPEGYARTRAGQWCAGRWVSWGTDNREGPVRKRGRGCWEVRLPDASAQMYLFVAGVVIAGVEGVRRGLELGVRDCQVDVAMLTEEERLELGVTEQLPTKPDEAFQLLLKDELLMQSIGGDLLTMYVTIQELYNKKLAEVGPEGSEERRAWLMARI